MEGVVGASLEELILLIDWSFVQATGRGRYELHPLIALYLHEYLQKSEDFLPISAAHAAYYADFMHQRLPHLKGGQQQLAALNEIQADFDNVSAAWRWVIEQQDYDNIEEMGEPLLLYMSIRTGNGLSNYARKLATTTEQPHRMLSYLLSWMDDPTEADVQRALSIAEQYHDQRARAFALGRLALVFQMRYENATALHWYAESLSLFRQLGEENYVADTLNTMTQHYQAFGDYMKATQAAEESYRICRAIGDYIGLGSSLHSLASASLYQGDYAASERYIGESQTICKEFGNRYMLFIATLFRGHFPLLTGDYDSARQQYHEALAIADDIGGELPKVFALLRGFLANAGGDYWTADKYFNESRGPARPAIFVTLWLNWAQSVAKCGLGDYALAQEYLCAAFQFAHQSNNIALMTMCLPSAALILWYKQQKGLAVEVMALWFTHPKSLHGWFVKSPLGAQVVEDMKADLGEAAFDEAWQRGAGHDLHDTVAALLALFAEPENAIQE
jgi:tetratricopeptide (TPR) repeat protein